MPARDSLHYQVQMLSELDAPTSVLGDLLDGFERSQRGLPAPAGAPSALPNPSGLFAPPERGGTEYQQGRLGHVLGTALKIALPHYVEPAMTPIVTAAAEVLPDENLMPEDLPHTHGFLLIPGGVMNIDIRGRMMVHNAVLWAQRGGGVDLYWLSNKYDERDQMNIIIRGDLGQRWDQVPLLTLAMYIRLEFGSPLPKAIGGQKVLPPEIAQQVQVIRNTETGELAWFWPEGYNMDEWMSGVSNDRTSSESKWLIALWRLMQQTLTDVEEEKVERGLRKQAVRVQMKQSAVTVVKLRKKRSDRGEGEGESHVEWSHRHWRKAHYRNVWCGSGDHRYQRAVYIHEVLVLADREDLPILQRQRVYDLAR